MHGNLKTMNYMAPVVFRQKCPALLVYSAKRIRRGKNKGNGFLKYIFDFLKLNAYHVESHTSNDRQLTMEFQRKWIPGTIIQPKVEMSAIKLIEISGQKVGVKVAIGVKMDHVMQSNAQREYLHQVKQTGGVYIITTSFEQFLEQWNRI
jgi:hypothetical protein